MIYYLKHSRAFALLIRPGTEAVTPPVGTKGGRGRRRVSRE